MKYDLIVIGAGPGGYVAAIKAAGLKKKVALIEKEQVGGTCLNRGCVPTKTLLHTADLYQQLQKSSSMGLLASDVRIDLPTLYARKDAVVSDLRNGINKLIESNGIDLIHGEAKVLSPSTIEVNNTIYSTEHLLLATGSLPNIPPIPGATLEGVVTSDDLLKSPKAYDSLLIIGGGVIGVEFATFYQSIGCNVTILEMKDRILPTLDREISQNLSMILKKRGITIITGAMVDRIEKDEEDLICYYQTKKSSDHAESLLQNRSQGILMATGRKGNTSTLCLDNIGLQTEHGYLPTNSSYETKVDGVYAIGDVVLGGPQLAHVASAQGINVVSSMFQQVAPYHMSSYPACIYTNPEIASVGMTLEEAKASGYEVVQGKAILSANCKSMIEMTDRGFVKLIFDQSSMILLGAHLMCLRATDLIGELCTAVANGLTARQLQLAIKPHPTLCEAIHEAVDDALGGSIHTLTRHR